MKTFSVVLKVREYWIVNHAKELNLNDINWENVEHYCENDPEIVAFGYQYCHNSHEYHPRCITVLKERNELGKFVEVSQQTMITA